MTQQLSAIGDDGSNVDWWFIYKVPKNASGTSGSELAKASGYEYVYFDNRSSALAGSQYRLDSPDNALSRTLLQLADASASRGLLFYNDELPPGVPGAEQERVDWRAAEQYGHCKGLLAFDQDSDSAIWLLHSTPRFPQPGTTDFPTDELLYGQTFLCISLKDAQTATLIAQQMQAQQQPQAYGAALPAGAPPVWQALSAKQFVQNTPTSILPFQSRGGMAFQSIAKTKTWGQDLWTDLVCSTLGCDLDVESWRRGAIPSASAGTDVVDDVTAIDMTPLGLPFAWPETKDHAKWASSLRPGEGNWVCVADINRQVSQEQRGGGTICFQHELLWTELAKIDQIASEKRQ